MKRVSILSIMAIILITLSGCGPTRDYNHDGGHDNQGHGNQSHGNQGHDDQGYNNNDNDHDRGYSNRDH
ncbi:MAG: hypothetical protein GXP13_06895 [Gammaproteobacteria bacterium]|nr:hypothetical protein [Gammaproteobacteria bacterium]